MKSRISLETWDREFNIGGHFQPGVGGRDTRRVAIPKLEVVGIEPVPSGDVRVQPGSGPGTKWSTPLPTQNISNACFPLPPQICSFFLVHFDPPLSTPELAVTRFSGSTRSQLRVPHRHSLGLDLTALKGMGATTCRLPNLTDSLHLWKVTFSLSSRSPTGEYPGSGMFG